MMLVDTSVWADHFRRGLPELSKALLDGQVACHEFVHGELLLGFVRRHAEVLPLIEQLPMLPPASHEEVVEVVRRARLEGSGIGWVDAHLLASAILSHSTIWTLDKALLKAATLAKVDVRHSRS